MKILRNRFGLAVLTLLAFSVQIAVAALHHHEVNPRSGFAARAMTAGLCTPASKEACDHDRGRHAHDDCVLCWAAAMAHNSLEPPSPAELTRPPLRSGTRFEPHDTRVVDVIHRDNFQARGPPASARA